MNELSKITKDMRSCFIIMPFDKRSDEIYKNVIIPALRELSITHMRADDLQDTSTISFSVQNAIQNADIIIADLSGQNPNVFYEVGFAHALGKQIVLLSQEPRSIPFDLSHYHVLLYRLDNIKSIYNLNVDLIERLKAILSQSRKPAANDTSEYAQQSREENRTNVKKIIYESKMLADEGNIDEASMRIQNFANSEEAKAHFEEASILFNSLGSIYFERGEFSSGLPFLQKALDLSLRTNLLTLQSTTYGNLANVTDSLGRFEESQEFYKRAIELGRRSGRQELVSSLQNNLGQLYIRMKRYAEAEEVLGTALGQIDKEGDVAVRASTLGNLAAMKYSLQDYSATESLLQEVLELYKRLGDARGIAGTLHQLGLVRRQLNDLVSSETLLRESLDIKLQINDNAGLATTFLALASIQIEKNDIQSGLEFFAKAINIQQDTGDKYGLMVSLSNLSIVTEALGDKKRAIDFLSSALYLAEALGSPERADLDKRLALLRGEMPEWTSAPSEKESER